MNILMNLLWMLFGGILTAIGYLIASLGLMITIIGIPFGLQTLKLSLLALCPFGKEVHTTPQAGGCYICFADFSFASPSSEYLLVFSTSN